MKRTLWIVLLALTLCAPMAFGAMIPEVSPDLVRWPAVEAGAGLELVVAGPLGVVRAHFGVGESPVLGNAVDGGALVDGLYTWELRGIAPTRDRDGGQVSLLNSVRTQKVETQFGYLRVVDGVFMVPQEEDVPTPSGPSDPFAKDQVFLDDVIVDGKLCVGFACVNNESFGDETQKIKGTTVRLLFQDTSTLSAYPTTDWRLVANDSGSGGANYFAIEDVDAGRKTFLVEAGSPASALYVDSSGRIGAGTANPGESLHLVSSNSPSVRLEQTTGEGFLAKTWDIGGNEVNFFVEEVSASQFPFRIQPGAPTSSLDIDDTGNVGVGTNNADTINNLSLTTTAKPMINKFITFMT